MQIRIEQSKGKKDRYTLLSKKTLITLRQYFSEYKPKVWLFEGEGGGQYTDSSIYQIFKKALAAAGKKRKCLFIACAIRLQHICLKMEPTYDIFKVC